MIFYKGAFLVFSDPHWYIYRWNYISEICFTIIQDGEAESRWVKKETGLAATDHEAGDGIFFSVYSTLQEHSLGWQVLTSLLEPKCK